MTPHTRPLAPSLAALVEQLTGRPLAVGIRAYDGSAAGPPDAPTLEITSHMALRRMAWQPGELGIADDQRDDVLSQGLSQLLYPVADRVRAHGTARHCDISVIFSPRACAGATSIGYRRTVGAG